MSPQSQRTDNLAAAFQGLITVGERLRSNRQSVSDAASFRAQIWEGVRVADRDARTFGYQPEDIELRNTFAVITFLDESILNLRHPIFADWPRLVVQERTVRPSRGGWCSFRTFRNYSRARTPRRPGMFWRSITYASGSASRDVTAWEDVATFTEFFSKRETSCSEFARATRKSRRSGLREPKHLTGSGEWIWHRGYSSCPPSAVRCWLWSCSLCSGSRWARESLLFMA